LIIDRRSEKYDVVFEQSRVNIKRALAARRLFDDHWYQRHNKSGGSKQEQ
jgi:hypothetical protein